MFDMSNFLSTLLISLPAIIIALTFHEYAHGFVAYKLGDDTAYLQGRLTLNPLPHLDPIGFIMLLFFHFGWAKPVPVNPFHLRGDRTKGMMLVSFAGPAANMILAIAAAILVGLLQGVFSTVHSSFFTIFMAILTQLVFINVVLAIFNLIPIPPLDGSKILAGLIPSSQEWIYKLEQYGFIILILLMVTGIIGKILNFIINPIYWLLIQLAQSVYGLFA